MTGWTRDNLGRGRGDRTSPAAVPIWVVRSEDDLHIRSLRGCGGYTAR